MFGKRKPPKGYEKLDIKELHFVNGKYTLVSEHPMFASLIDAIATFFIDAGGKNYVCLNCWHNKIGHLEIAVQRAEGKTPAQMNAEIKALIKEHRIGVISAEECVEAIERVFIL